MPSDVLKVQEAVMGSVQEALNEYFEKTTKDAKEIQSSLEELYREIAPDIGQLSTLIALGKYDEARTSLAFFRDGMLIRATRATLNFHHSQVHEINTLVTSVLRTSISVAMVLV